MQLLTLKEYKYTQVYKMLMPWRRFFSNLMIVLRLVRTDAINNRMAWDI